MGITPIGGVPPETRIVTLGNRNVEVTVTDANKKFIADGDLTNDLPEIMQLTGDANKVERADFLQAFAPADAGLLARMSQGIKPYALDLTKLGSPDVTKSFNQILASKPYLRVVGAAGMAVTPTPDQLKTKLAAMTVTGRNGVLSELATETAMMQARNTALKTMGPDLTAKVEGLGGDAPAAAASLKKSLAAMTGDPVKDKQTLINAVLAHPDMPLANKHNALTALGITDLAARNTQISTSRAAAMTGIRAEAKTIFTNLGGTGEMGETHSVATGDGTGTKGIGNTDNAAIGYMSYADVKKSGGQTVGGISTQTTTVTPRDITQPVRIHLSASGANGPGSTMSVSRGAQTLKFTISQNPDGTTSLAHDPASPWVKGVRWDAGSQTLTFPPGSEPLTVTQNSGADEVQGSATFFNASTGGPSLAVDFGKLFESDDFKIDYSALPPAQQTQLKKYAEHLAADPTRTLTLDLAGKGPTDFDGSALTEVGSYGAEGSGSSRDDFGGLRSSMLDVNADTGKGTITATTDPVKSNLLVKGKSPLDAKGLAALQRYMAKNPGLTANDALAGMRAYAIKEMLSAMVVAAGGNAAQINVGSSTVDRKAAFTEQNFKDISGGQPTVANLPAAKP
ncbi:MAG: hypothetical protein H7338_22450 [Candidatus Sericytochromatia bacterium]|nr:hypothetical protein [Candidatus Sericytochromatia bacterium]